MSEYLISVLLTKSESVIMAVWSSRSSPHQDLAATDGCRPGDWLRRCEKGAERSSGGTELDRAGHCQTSLSSLTYQSDGVLIAEITTTFLSDSIRLNRD